MYSLLDALLANWAALENYQAAFYGTVVTRKAHTAF
jgi:hypothetical protein